MLIPKLCSKNYNDFTLKTRACDWKNSKTLKISEKAVSGLSLRKSHMCDLVILCISMRFHYFDLKWFFKYFIRMF